MIKRWTTFVTGFALVSALAVVGTLVDDDAYFQVQSISFVAPADEAHVRDVLARDGILAITEIPNLATARENVLRATAECALQQRLVDEGAPVSMILKDGSTRFSWASYVSQMHQEPVTATPQCPGLQEKMDKLQEAVNVGSLYFSQLLDDAIRVPRSDNGLFSRQDGKKYTSFNELLFNGKHLDHFHVYQTQQEDFTDLQGPSGRKDVTRLSSLELHTDQGLFIAFVPSIRVGMDGSMDKNEDSFFIQAKDGRTLVRARFPLSGDALIFMIGDGFNFIPKEAAFPTYAVPHALSLRRMPEKSLRSWFGRMFFAPNDAMLSTHGETFQSILGNVIASRPDFPVVGCSQSERKQRRLQDGTGQSCAEGELYCWLSCEPITDLPCSQDEVQCRSGNGQIWVPCDDCHDYSAKPVCPTLAPTTIPELEIQLDIALDLRYRINETIASFRLISKQQGYIGFGIGTIMTSSVAIIGMDVTANPSRPAVGIYKITTSDGDLLPLATSSLEMEQFGIVHSAFESQSSGSTLEFTIKVGSENALFSLLRENINVIYAVGPPEFVEHDFYGTRYALDFSPAGFGNKEPSKTQGVYVVDSVLAAHIVIMIIAWQVLSPLGVMMPLFNNPKYGSPSICSGSRWFQFHWIFQTIAVILGYVGVLLGYLHVQSRQSDSWNTKHKIIGLVVLLLSIVQPLLGHFRPHQEEEPTSNKRRAFEIVHPFLGYSLVSLAMANAVLGIQEIGTISGHQPYLSFIDVSHPTAQGYSGPLGIAILVLLALFCAMVLVGKLRVIGMKWKGTTATKPERVVDEKSVEVA